MRINGRDFYKCPICNLFFSLNKLVPIKKIDILNKTMQVIRVCAKCKQDLLLKTKDKLQKRRKNH